MNNLKFKTQKAFTLIELLVVIAIVGILAGMVVINMSGATDTAKMAKSKSFSASVRSALLMNRVAEWNFEEGTGTTTIDTIGASNGTFVSAPAWRSGSDCVFGGCLQFDGADDLISIGAGNNLDITGAFTLGVWAKPSTVSGTKTVFYRGTAATVGGYAINQEGDSFRGYFYDTTWQSAGLSSVIEANKWYYILLSYDRSLLKLYINGKLDKQASFTTPVNAPAGAYAYIGAVSPTVQRFNGYIDEVRLYNAVLSASRIREDYLAGLDKLLAGGQITQKEYQENLSKLNSTYATSE